jgi:ParB-like chromosome segregation protein Spo0J
MTDNWGELILARRAATQALIDDAQQSAQNHADNLHTAVLNAIAAAQAAAVAAAKTYTDAAIAKIVADNNLKP